MDDKHDFEDEELVAGRYENNVVRPSLIMLLTAAVVEIKTERIMPPRAVCVRTYCYSNVQVVFGRRILTKVSNRNIY